LAGIRRILHPCTDVGWRLAKEHWNKGYATEGAIRCLQYAHDTLLLPVIYATAPAINLPSIHVMQKAGMQYHTDFIHPRLANDERLRHCVAYISKQ
jgi:RimJ/RimL family protein N-acetyltransferase